MRPPNILKKLADHPSKSSPLLIRRSTTLPLRRESVALSASEVGPDQGFIPLSPQKHTSVDDPCCPARCNERGCVFPAKVGAMGRCFYHHLQRLEPGCFQSLQPTMLLLERAKFGLPDSEPEDSRLVDRRRLATERADFMLGQAA